MASMLTAPRQELLGVVDGGLEAQVSQQIHRNQAPPREDHKPLARNSS